MTILDKIIEDKRLEVTALKQAVPLDYVRSLATELAPGKSLKQALLNSGSGIISEFKRKSPSLGFINEGAEVETVVRAYEKAGCSGVSVLTDCKYFGGADSDIKSARKVLSCPVLRKDFMVDPYQIYVSRLLGADVILLIAAALSLDEAYDMGEIAHELGMEVLLEVHNEDELEYMSRYTDIVGVNNRNLKTFKTDVQTSFDLVNKIPSGLIKVSESGISDPLTVRYLREAGFNGFLIGEAFMKHEDPGDALSRFIKEIG